MHTDLIIKSNNKYIGNICAIIPDLQTYLQEHHNCCKQVYNSITLIP